MASGSSKRQRTKVCHVRLTPEEMTAVAAKADRAGLTKGAFARAAMLGTPGPRARRRPPADHRTLRQLLGHCGRIGNNVNQIARQLNAGGRANVPELREALRAYLDIRTAIFQALGMTAPKSSHDRQGRQPRRS